MTTTKASFDRALDQLTALGQESTAQELRASSDRLTDAQKHALELQIEALDPKTLTEQVALATHRTEAAPLACQPFLAVEQAPTSAPASAGPIAEGQVACLVVAGGQGSRLGFDGPKGMYPVSPTGKTLFQLIAEKVVAASAWAGRPLPLAIMTSPLNHEATVAHFEGNARFGLEPEQLVFFTQEMLPYLDDEGHLFCDAEGHLATGPTGNGVALQRLHTSGIWEQWHKQGVRYVNFVQVDNVLSDPFDIRLIEHHIASEHDVTIKCIERNDPNEKVGVVVRQNGTAAVLEYSEISDEDRLAETPSGALLHRCANMSAFCFSMDFIERVSTKQTPWHLAYKAVGRVDSGGVHDPGFHAWKFEKFIFDVLPETLRAGALLYLRHECFAPLKSAESLEGVQAALSERFHELHTAATGRPATDDNFELDPTLYYHRR